MNYNQKLLPKEDNPLYLFAPHLFGYKDGCDIPSTEYDIRESPYFDQFKAIKDNIDKYTNEDLRTLAYLSKMHIDRVAYNPKHIDYYLQDAGLISRDESVFRLACVDIDCPCDYSKDIDYEAWKGLEDGRVPRSWTHWNSGKVQRELYIESFDTPKVSEGLEWREGETPIK